MNTDERREYLKLKKREYRAKESTRRQHLSTKVNIGRVSSTRSTHAEAEAETEEKNTSCAKAPEGGSSSPKVEAPVVEEKKPRGLDEVSEAIAVACGKPIKELNGADYIELAQAKKLIHQSTPDVTPQEIHLRAVNYRKTMKGAILTPRALAKHWSSLGSVPPVKPDLFDPTERVLARYRTEYAQAAVNDSLLTPVELAEKLNSNFILPGTVLVEADAARGITKITK
jgi:hypothetical protein